MKKLLILSLLSICAISVFANDNYKYTIDLTKVNEDKVFVELEPPTIKENEITFYLPKIIPGTYSIADYGRMVSEFTAYDKKGRKLEVERLDDNSWTIKSAKKLAKISYWVEDTYDTEKDGPDIFEPAGTNIEADKNYVLNPSGFFGYFEGMKEMPFDVNIIRKENFYGATGLVPATVGADLSTVIDLEKSEKAAASGKKVDQFKVEDYDRLVDSPIMYSAPDTALIKVADTEVLIASYSPNKMVTAEEIAASIKEILQAQKEYLGGELPVNKYAFIFYFTDQPVLSYGALEHSYSSFYYMPEMRIQAMAQQLRDFAAHEFFHIVTPLTIHSEEIDNFDFNDPKMSKHLWMYEGVTEYFAGNMQIQYDLIGPDEYLEMIREKMITASDFLDTVAFTDISKFTLEKYSDQYYNVYLKGALIGLALDLKLLELSNGEYGLQELMHDLSKKYGKNSAFDDEQLFDIITEMTYPEIGEFLKTYVGGTKPLPYKEIFETVGINYIPEENIEFYSIGLQQQNITIAEHEGQKYLAIAGVDNLNAMGDSLAFEEGDILLKINGQAIPPLGPEIGPFIGNIQNSLDEGQTLSYTVLRKDDEGNFNEVELSSPVFKVQAVQQHLFELMENPTEKQLLIREAWLRP